MLSLKYFKNGANSPEGFVELFAGFLSLLLLSNGFSKTLAALPRLGEVVDLS